MLQNVTPLRKSAPWPPNISDGHVSCYCACHRKMHLCRSSSHVPRLPSFLEMRQNPHVFAHFWQGAQSLAPATRKHIWTSKSAPYPTVVCTFDFGMCFAPKQCALFPHLNFQKWSEHGGVLYIFTWKCASRHNGVHFLDISTSKSGPNMSVFYTFWLGNVLRATTACNFSSLVWPDGSAPAALASLLFGPPEPQIIGKTQMFCDFPTFFARPGSSFFWDFLFSDLLSSSLLFSSLLWLFPPVLFHLPILSEVWLLNFLR